MTLGMSLCVYLTYILLEKFQSLPPFKTELCYLIEYLLNTSPFSDIIIANIFSQSVALFLSYEWCFSKRSFQHWWNSIYLMNCLFHIVFKKSPPSPKSRKFPLCFLQATFSLYLGMWSILGLYRWFKKQVKVFLFCFIMVVYEHPFVLVPFVKQTMCSSLNWFES